MAKKDILFGLFLLAFLLFLATGEAAVRFGTSVKANPHYVLPALAALEKGFWKEQGLEVNWLPFDSGTTMVRAVAAGEVEVGTLGLNTLILAVARGIPMTVVADPGIATIFYLWVIRDSPINKPEDLKGAKIGVTGFGADSHFYALAALKALGLEKSVKFLSMGGVGPQVAGLRARVIDATNLSFFTVAILRARGEVKEVLRVQDYIPKEYAHLQMTFTVWDFLNKQSEAIRKAHRGFIQGEDFVLKNRGWAVDKMKGDFRYPEAAAQAAYPMLSYTPKTSVDKSQVKGNIRFLVEYGVLKEDRVPALEKLIAEGFVP